MRLTNSAHMRIALVAPVAQPVPPPRSGSIETVTALLANGLVARGHEVTLFATGDSVTDAGLHALFPRGYNQDPALWPWELCELLNLAAAVERAERFDVIHYQAEYAPIALAYDRTSPAPVLQTMHHAPTPPEVALWMHYRNAPFVAISSTQAKLMTGLNVVATIHHALDMEAFAFCEASGGYLLFLGRFTEGKGVLVAIEVARRTGRRLVLAAPENAYYRETVAPWSTDSRSSMPARWDHERKSRSSVVPTLSSIRSRRLSPSAWSSLRRWHAERPSRPSTSVQCQKLWTMASPAISSTR